MPQPMKSKKAYNIKWINKKERGLPLKKTRGFLLFSKTFQFSEAVQSVPRLLWVLRREYRRLLLMPARRAALSISRAETSMSRDR